MITNTIKYPLDSSLTTISDPLSIIKNDLKLFLLTQNGERVIRRSRFGVNTMDLLFSPNVDIDSGVKLLESYSKDYLARNWQGVVVTKCDQINISQNAGSGIVDIEIIITDTNLGNSDSLIISGG